MQPVREQKTLVLLHIFTFQHTTVSQLGYCSLVDQGPNIVHWALSVNVPTCLSKAVTNINVNVTYV